MNLEEIKSKVAKMSQAQQDHLAAFLVHLRNQRDINYRSEIAEKIDDKNSANWVSLEKLKQDWKS